MITREQIYLDEKLETKSAVFEFIAQEAEKLGVTVHREQLVQDLWEREKGIFDRASGSVCHTSYAERSGHQTSSPRDPIGT